MWFKVMSSLNPPCLIFKILIGLIFSIAIISLALAVSCEGKHLKTLSQTPPNPKSSYDHSSNVFIPPSYNISIQDSINAASISFDESGPLMSSLDENLSSATASCRKLLSLASHNLNLSLPKRDSATTRETLIDFKTYLCGTMAYIDTCLDAFKYAPKKTRNMVAASLDSLRNNIINGLTILTNVDDHDPNLVNGGMNAWPPSWLSSEERELLFVDTIKTMAANVVVAKDGSGRFRTINEAIRFAPKNSAKRFVIYVKQGRYYENVKIDESRWNIIMYGDGMYKTIVSGKLSYASGSSTIDSATFAVYGQGFIARDMGFENTAGPSAGQAVAFLSASDKSVIYKCSISGYQDTLFAYANRQFYRECKISGTIDFIFGQASSALFQACTIIVREPHPGQFNTITAQGRLDQRCPCGFSIHKSAVQAAGNLGGAKTFLGRPWTQYATTVVMESYLGGFIDERGWMPWQGSSKVPDTVYYREFQNEGAGASKSKVRPQMSSAEASKFTVRMFIGGAQWLPKTGVPFQSDF